MSTPRLPDPIGSVPPEPWTLRAVIADARRRRVRRLGVFGGTGAAVLLTAVLAMSIGGGDGSQTIGVTDSEGGTIAAGVDESRPPSDSSPDPAAASGGCTHDGETTTCMPEEQTVVWGPTVVFDPTPEQSAAPSTSPGSAPASPPEPTQSPYPTPTKTADARPTPSPRPARPTSTAKPSPSSYPTPTPDPAPTGEPSQDARGEMTRTYVEGSVQCKDGLQWCADALPPPAGRPLTFTVRACRDADAGPGKHETGPPGADFEVHDGSGPVWRWSSGQAFPAVMMTIDVDAGDCLQWQTTWKGVDDTNQALPAGRYDGVARVTAEPVRDPIKYVVTLT